MQATQTWLAPRVERVARQRHLMSIRDGVVSALPLVIVGSVFMLIAFPPVKSWQDWIAAHQTFSQSLIFAIKATMGLVSLVVAFTVAHGLAARYELDGIGADDVGVESMRCDRRCRQDLYGHCYRPEITNHTTQTVDEEE